MKRSTVKEPLFCTCSIKFHDVNIKEKCKQRHKNTGLLLFFVFLMGKCVYIYIYIYIYKQDADTVKEKF